MPKVPLTATKDFTYMTRRLVAGDPFDARNPLEARILKDVRKVAEEPKVRPSKAPEPVAAEVAAEEAAAPVEEAAKRPILTAKAPPRRKAGARARKAKAKK